MQVRIVLLMAMGIASGAMAATEAPGIPGQYTLQAREINSRLLLEPDNTFSAMIEYAGAQGSAKGHWQQVGDTLKLTSDVVEPPAENLLFDLSRSRSLAELTDPVASKQAQGNYVLNLRYARSSPVPTIAPVTVVFEFNQGPETRLQWNNSVARRLYLPFSEQRSLTRVGFQAAGDQPVQWFAIDPQTRTLTLDWKVDRANGQMSYDKPQEFNLAQSQQYLRNAPRELTRIKDSYILSMNYGVAAEPPPIKPVDIFWSFSDGTQATERWTDSQQKQLLTPVATGKSLQKLGVKSAADANPQWFDVTPDSRSLDLMWDVKVNQAQLRDLSDIFKTLQLNVKNECLEVDLGNGLACYRK
ncbi:hypothetical protein [Pseudomonas vancouverensis]|uniref:Uncharacterized protein n=1 Tax=Pseudomonas vancouverensis TaxID=95300 RepID=A0A1H2P9J1_PSEVA|nr:hypothetical protein [Pseudomonas vancouverensis]KAB0500289.1 hypothetical protein F7R09_03675 [Pseudomonas vancouverensis]TDB58967.1 hypothetical protein EIY72_21960 [Pseudomonas vancouverensis]SDV13955.1 hypothetical protein SAMN05216558_4185 [Pseudomonas vancouverensis]